MKPATFATTRLNHKRHGYYKIGNGGMALLITGFLVLVLVASGTIKIPGSVTGGTGTTCINGVSPPVGYSCTALPIAFSLNDPLAGTAYTSTNIKVYQGLSILETPQTGSAGTVTSGLTYQTGQQLTCYSAPTSSVVSYLPCTAPPIPTGQSGLTSVTLPLFVPTIGSWSQSGIATGGTTFTTAQQYSYGNTGLTQISVTWTITETANNKGWKATYDIVNRVNNFLVLEISDGGGASSNTQYVQIQGMQYTSKQGTTNYWQSVLPDGLGPQLTCTSGSTTCTAPAYATDVTGRYLPPAVSNTATSYNGVTVSGADSMQLVGSNTVGGSVNIPLTIIEGSLTSGNIVTLSFKIQSYYDPVYFLANGNGGPNVAQQGSTFTLKMRG